jgi:hypothetical protein
MTGPPIAYLIVGASVLIDDSSRSPRDTARIIAGILPANDAPVIVLVIAAPWALSVV